MSGYRIRSWISFALVGLMVAACDRAIMPVSDSAVAGYGMAGQPEGPSSAISEVAMMRGRAEEKAADKRVAHLQSPPQALPQPRVAGMIIRNGDVAIQVDSVEQAIAAARQLATSLGGYVGNVAIFTGALQVRSATLELKVPAQRFDEAMAGVRPLGKVERSASTADDVGEEFVDISARVANAKRLEARLLDILATRTGRLQDVLSVERELARVREEIERYEGRIRYLGARVATSTINVSVHEKAPIIAARPGTNIMGTAVVRMWRNFVNVVALGIESLGVVIPVLVLAWAALWIWRRVKRGAPAVARQTT
ncbi:MAG TPA: DUF4349 domain-containing protein [Gemmatimonadaceae bacterium]|nr:DUF4349 domain-containing protein [Gemmatimonadaceae bacterium]